MTEEKLNDLEKLISMAEKVSETVNLLHAKIANLRFIFLISIVGLYGSIGSIAVLLSKPNWVELMPYSIFTLLAFMTVALGIGSCYFIFQYFSKFKRYRYDLDLERSMLRKLLEMVDEYNANFPSKEMSFVERAIIEMRLQRIKYSGKW